MSASRTSLFTKLFRTPATVRRPQPIRTRLGLTALEAREVPSATLYNGSLYVYGTNSPDTLTVQSLAIPRVTGGANLVLRVTENGSVTDFARSAVTDKIYVYGLAGNDTISVNSSVPAVIDGGAGDDTLSGGTGADVFYGGIGVDSFPNAERQDRIIDPEQTGGRAMGKDIMDKWAATGRAAGVLGAPTKDQETGRGFDWCYFQGGVIVSSTATGTHEVHGAIEDKYIALGGGFGALGAPMSDELPAGTGRVSRFQYGNIYWSGATGAHVVYGAVRDKHEALGGAAGFLGQPTNDQESGRGYDWCYFQNGLIVSSPATGAHEVRGPILDKYLQVGGGFGALGAPTSDTQFLPGGGLLSSFQNGRIFWYPGSDAVVDAVSLKGIPGGDPQTDDWSCGPNSVSRVLRYYGYADATYSAVRARDLYHGDIFSRVKMGSKPSTLLDVMRHWKGDSQLVERTDMAAGMEPIFAALAKGRPVVALVNPTGHSHDVVGGHLPDSLHWVVVTGYDRATKQFSITNTSGRAETWSFDTFYQRWNWSAGGAVGDFLTGTLGVKERTFIY